MKMHQNLTSHDELTRYILNRINIDDMLISKKGVVDALDHQVQNLLLVENLGLIVLVMR